MHEKVNNEKMRSVWMEASSAFFVRKIKFVESRQGALC
ncbi:hypothetical protein B4129_2713 [Bacillus safensis]|nr:hypothetical protein B4129_2713 [Bacillus safensis]